MLHSLNIRRMQRSGFETREVKTQWGTLKAIVGPGTGGKPPIALVHGISGRASVFGRVAASLQPVSGRLVVPDLLGHGASEVPELLTFEALQDSLDALLIDLLPDKLVLVGVSLGGMLVTRHAARYPERVSGLVLCNPYGAPLQQQYFEEARALLTPKNHRDARRLAQAALALRSPLVHHLAAIRLQQRLKVPHIRSFLERVTPTDTILEHELRGLTMPVRLLIGEDDQLLPRQSIEWYADNLPAQSSIVKLPGVGHSPMIDSPDIFTSQITDFLHTLPIEQRASA
jgi:3-oxoadipate enol-lactonase